MKKSDIEFSRKDLEKKFTVLHSMILMICILPCNKINLILKNWMI